MTRIDPTALMHLGGSAQASSPIAAEHVSARFEALVREHQKSIFRVAYRLTGNADEAADLVQEALVEAFEAFPRFRSGTHFDRWLFRIMRNTYLDLVRRRSRAKVHSLDSDECPYSGKARELTATHFTADAEIMARTLDGPIQEALDALLPDYRMAVVLSDIEGLTYEEVAEVLGCPVGTVRSRLHRGRMILKEKLRSYVRTSNRPAPSSTR